ncbi:MAG: xanthine dehydrogenase family protein subunit M [Desulfomonile sp.]|jgi:xanthine dehydrogenase FAD-binding subunit|nr:xanthine dehydrogenase family protein subunit M [Deltaproteobacteria bacterium]
MREVFLPRTVEELWDIMENFPDAVLYAGGTDLLVQMRAGHTNPSHLVCLERVEALHGVRDEGDDVLIGAATTHSGLLENPLIRKEFPILAKGLGLLGSPPIRHMGTIGGNIVTASPAGDSLPPLYVLEAEVEIRSRTQMRRLPLKDFILGPNMVVLNEGEVLMGVWLRKQPRWNIHHYEKVGRRKAQACAIASMAALLKISDSGIIESARLAWGSVGPTVATSAEAERNLIGQPLTLETLERAAMLVEASVSPIDDIRASAEYRRAVSGALLLRLLDYSPPFLERCNA